MSKTFRARRTSKWDDDYIGNDYHNRHKVNKFKRIRENRKIRYLEEKLQYANDEDVSKNLKY